ncbi:hypothetical protein [Desulfotomaculum copahuensis]|uniref:Flagellar biosynthesis protein FlhF n=1 Tax=Desulfotomaculum copahuensis TaxID=1838280 RepID=A0A1B7LBM3_9FIRM|nr:hypothetical protein [Desulfotomaculum copahuensis]OAT79922.1 hypothetical protein A6M21_14525 [Desulfotomaculum copahuensis]
MKVKKYVVREMQEAMRLIRDDMGPEAVIISSYRLPRQNLLDFFRPLQLEVTAALDEPPGSAAPAGLPAGRGETCTIEVGAIAAGCGDAVRGAADAVRLAGVVRTVLPGGRPAVPAVRVENSTVKEKFTASGQENGPSSFNIILKQQEETLMEGDPARRWRRKLLEMEVLPEVVERLLDGLTGPDGEEDEAEELLRVRLKSRLAALVEPAYRPPSGAAVNHTPAGAVRPEPVAGRALITGRRERLLPGEDAGGVQHGSAPRAVHDGPVPDAGPPEASGRHTPAGHPDHGAARLSGRPGRDTGAEKAVYAFIGPTGVGKTTTLAKLATRLVLFENRRIALVALYSHRFGVAEELKFYGETLGVPAEVVMTPAELAAAVRTHRDKHAVLIDTEGVSHRNAAQLLKLKSFLDVLEPGREIFLTLSATTRSRDLLDMAGAFSRTGFTQLVFTKLDETAVRGPALNLVQQTGRPVSYVTAGQSVPDDLETLTPRRLAALLLEETD